jgi:hypothetical protein
LDFGCCSGSNPIVVIPLRLSLIILNLCHTGKKINQLIKKRARQFKDDEFDVATATTVDEAKELLKVGFE